MFLHGKPPWKMMREWHFPPISLARARASRGRLVMRIIACAIAGTALALASIADPRLSGVAFAQDAVEVAVLNLKLACDREQCRSPVLEVHERTGAGESSLEYVFAPPPGVTLDDAHATGVEVDGEGSEHYVRALAGPGWLKCKWLAKAKAAGADGFAKGYCWIAIKR
jgi:hypothetical protein